MSGPRFIGIRMGAKTLYLYRCVGDKREHLYVGMYSNIITKIYDNVFCFYVRFCILNIANLILENVMTNICVNTF